MRRKGLLGLVGDKANQIHSRMIGKTAIYLSLLLIVGVGFNLLGGKWLIVNQFICVVSALGLAVFLTRPKFFASGAVLAAGLNKKFPPKEGHKPLSYIDFIGYAMLTVSVTFMFLGTWSAKENPGALLKILLSLIVIGLMMWVWETTVKLGKKFAHAYAFGVLLISMFSIVPGTAWTKCIGHDPRVLFVISERDEAVNEVERLQAKKAEEADVNRIRGIQEVINQGFGISEDDKRFFERMQKERDEKTLPVFSKRLVSSALAVANPAAKKKGKVVCKERHPVTGMCVDSAWEEG